MQNDKTLRQRTLQSVILLRRWTNMSTTSCLVLVSELKPRSVSDNECELRETRQTPSKARDSHQTLPQNTFLSFDIVKSKPCGTLSPNICETELRRSLFYFIYWWKKDERQRWREIQRKRIILWCCHCIMMVRDILQHLWLVMDRNIIWPHKLHKRTLKCICPV